MERKTVGQRGEDIAAAYLQQRGYRLVDRNWSVYGRSRTQLGELDIVAERGGVVVFVEVKAGTSTAAVFRPELHVTPHKAVRLRRAARAWLAAHGRLAAQWQIDVVAIVFPHDATARVRHFRSAVSDTH